jgi:hypothetical protein
MIVSKAGKAVAVYLRPNDFMRFYVTSLDRYSIAVLLKATWDI